MAITIKGIAKKANVSASAVSAVINNSEKYVRVSDVTRDRIQKIIEEVGYVPNILAQSNRRGCTYTVGLIVDNFASRPVSLIIEGLTQVLKDSGYHLIIGTSSQSPEQEQFYIKNFLSRRVDGIVAIPLYSNKKLETFRSLYTKQYPLVFCERPGITGMDCVFSNLEGGTQEATEYLIEMGHKNIAFVIGDLESSVTKTALIRYNGYRNALEEHGLKVKDEYCIATKDHLARGGQEAAQQILSMRLEERPTAVLFRNDEMAASAMRVLQENGVKIPDDISIIGFENKPITESLTPALTTISTPNYDVGIKAAGLILEKIEKAKKGQTIHTSSAISIGIMPKLIIRQTCAPPALNTPNRS